MMQGKTGTVRNVNNTQRGEQKSRLTRSEGKNINKQKGVGETKK